MILINVTICILIIGILRTTTIYGQPIKESNETVTIEELEVLDEIFGICPYCDPNYIDVPNMQSAMKGYDLPMGDPNRAGIEDPGVRNQIFIPMKVNDFGFMEVDGGFITPNDMIECDSSWTEDVYHNFKSYLRGKAKNSFFGLDLKFGEGVTIPYKPHAAVPITVNFQLPTLFSRSTSRDNEIQKVRDFLIKDHGSIAISQAVCTTHRIDIAPRSKKAFTMPFIDAVKGLQIAATENDTLKEIEFKRFIDEFGTHYAKTTILGVRLLSERRYDTKERANYQDKELKNCNTASGVKVIGMQVDPDLEQCQIPSLMGDDFSSHELQRFIVTTFGSYAVSNASEWGRQIADMYLQGNLYPVPVKRDLVPILDLFQDSNFEGIQLNDEKLNMTTILKWVVPKMANYCVVFDMNCSALGSDQCGWDDKCKKDEWCTPIIIDAAADDDDDDDDDEALAYKCEYKSVNKTLGNGAKYEGQVNIGGSPSGSGKLFYPNEKNLGGGRLHYVGQFSHGLRHGLGLLYFTNGSMAFKGHFKNDQPNGISKSLLFDDE